MGDKHRPFQALYMDQLMSQRPLLSSVDFLRLCYYIIYLMQQLFVVVGLLQDSLQLVAITKEFSRTGRTAFKLRIAQIGLLISRINRDSSTTFACSSTLIFWSGRVVTASRCAVAK